MDTMIAGLYLKNYKCYQGTQYIPGLSNEVGQLTGYLGDNGVGKSAILEGLETFFSKKPHWSRNKEAKKGQSECFVAPIFVLNKKALKASISLAAFKDLRKNANLTLDSTKFEAVCVVRREDGIFTLFDGKKEFDDDKSQKVAKSIYKTITDLYKYVYLDAEINIDETARINSGLYDIIIGSSIVAEVEKKFKDNDQKGQLVANLNTVLESLIGEKLVNRLKLVNKDYSYIGVQGSISKLTTNVLAQASTYAFLSSRKLTLKGKQLDDLSSGQRRTALLDFIVSVLDSGAVDKNKTLILAIDEPEISLDASKKLSQFEKLIEIAMKGTPVLFTSHWYGWIATTNFGRSILIEEKDSAKRDITTYENTSFPFRDVPKYEMRMIFDFLMSLGSGAEANKDQYFIVCEGPSDATYLSKSLGDPKYKIIPGGKDRVHKLANIFKDYYWKDSGPTIKNVLFLSDTDPDQKDKFENAYLRRWSKNDDLVVSLISTGQNAHTKCEIEDTLEPGIFLEALKKIYPKESLIQSLAVVHTTLYGADAFGMDAVRSHQFKGITKNLKTELAKEYGELLIKKNPGENRLQSLINGAF